MAFNINEFVGALKHGGARSTLFQVFVSNPVNAGADAQLPFLCKAASLPASVLGVIEMPYFGRKIKVAGDRTYDDWTVTIINDEDFAIKNALEEWSHAINSSEGNIRQIGSNAPSAYRSDAFVKQYSKTGAVIREVKLVNLWPSNISEIELSWENTDAVEEYTVTFQYDRWEISGGITGDAGGI